MNKRFIFYGLIITLFMNIALWCFSKDYHKQWQNVPQAPSHAATLINFGGDTQLAYRTYASILQNTGSMDGQSVSLKEYDHQSLKDWFFASDRLDPKSDVVPVLAAYYFGGINDSGKLQHVLDYLSHVGSSAKGEKWRWLGHAVFIARHQMQNNDKALELAYKLADNKSPDLADWAKQMPVFILNDQGESELAYKIMLNLLISNADKMHPNELFFMQEYICTKIIPNMALVEIPKFCHNFQSF